jgi:hypothetical protein
MLQFLKVNLLCFHKLNFIVCYYYNMHEGLATSNLQSFGVQKI